MSTFERSGSKRPPRRLLLVACGLLFTVMPATASAEKPRPAPAAAPAAPATETTAAAPKESSAESKGAAKGAGGSVNVVETQETKEGVKTYKFGAVEVESRLKSPQLTYFLRRVRAEFSAGDLGHRSFMRELAETTRHPAFR